MRSPAPAPPIAASLILPAIFWGQNYVPVRLFIQIFLSFSSYLFLLFFSYILKSVCCFKYILIPEKSLFEEKYFYFLAGKTHIRHSEGFFVGTKPFLIHLGSKCIYRCDNLILLFISLLILLFLSHLILLVQ